MKIYGNLNNRIEEGHNYNKDKLIHEGDDITMYLWSDRECYYVTKVIDQKYIKVKRYEVVASRDNGEPNGMGHQNWKYFKTRKEAIEYLNQFDGFDLDENPPEYTEEEWTFRYGKWKKVVRVNPWTGESLEKPEYNDLSGKISIGIRDYYYDWEF